MFKHLYFVFFFVLILFSAGQVQADNGRAGGERFPKLNHVLILDCSGSMSGEHSGGKKGAGYNRKSKFIKSADDFRFTDNVVDFMTKLFTADGKVFCQDAQCMVYPACEERALVVNGKEYRCKHVSERRDIYKKINFRLGEVGKVFKKLSGPCDDGALAGSQFRDELRNAREEAKKRFTSGDFYCYWFLTDNSKDSDFSNEFLDYALERGDYKDKKSPFCEVFCILLGELKGGKGGLVVYVLLEKRSDSKFSNSNLVDFAGAINRNLQSLKREFKDDYPRKLVDMRELDKDRELVGKNPDKSRIPLIATPEFFNVGKKSSDYQYDYGSFNDGKEVLTSSEEWEGNRLWDDERLHDVNLMLKDNDDGSCGLSLRGKIYPKPGWKIRKIENKDEIQSYELIGFKGSEESGDSDKLKEHLHIYLVETKHDFIDGSNEAVAMTEDCENQGAIYAYWLIKADKEARDIISRQEDGIKIKFDFSLDTEIDFSKNKSKESIEQSGLYIDASKIEHGEELLRYLLGGDCKREGTIKCKWVGDKNKLPTFVIRVSPSSNWNRYFQIGGLVLFLVFLSLLFKRKFKGGYNDK